MLSQVCTISYPINYREMCQNNESWQIKEGVYTHLAIELLNSSRNCISYFVKQKCENWNIGVCSCPDTGTRSIPEGSTFFVKPFKTSIAFDLMSQNLLLALCSSGRRWSSFLITAVSTDDTAKANQLTSRTGLKLALCWLFFFFFVPWSTQTNSSFKKS